MQYDHHHMGKVIRELRKQRRKSQEVISGLAGIDRTHLAKIEMGQHSANVETLWKIAAAFDMPLSELFRLLEEAMRKTEE